MPFGRGSRLLWLAIPDGVAAHTCITKSGNKGHRGIRAISCPDLEAKHGRFIVSSRSEKSERAGVETVVGEGSSLEGKIVVAEGIRVDGVVTGRLEVGGNIRVGRTGQIVANIVCSKDVVVAGRVEGDLVCEGEIRLEASAVVLGDISGTTLVVEEGAVLRGLISVGSVEEAIESENVRRAANV